jgi:acyl-CoA reductase-like NAD-dependent aldehyde dehydrogenase
VNTFDGFFLPGLRSDEVERWAELELAAGALRVRYPQLRPGVLAARAAAVRAARPLQHVPAHELPQRIAAVARLLRDPHHPLRREADRLLPLASGYSPAMLSHTLERMAIDWEVEPLQRLHAQSGGATLLDGFGPPDARGRRTMAIGPAVALHIFAGNVPGVAVTSLVRALLVKASSLGKLAAGDPVLPVLFARAAAETDAQLASALLLTYWPGGNAAAEQEALAAVDLAVVYGGSAAVQGIRERAPPELPVVLHGPRLSLAIIAREVLAGDINQLVADAAYAVAVFDQQGCVSPHLFYVEEGGETSAAAFAELLHQALLALDPTLPRGELTAAEAGAIRALRTRVELAEISGAGLTLHGDPALRATVILDPDPRPAVSCLNRTVFVKPVADAAAVSELLAPAGLPLQTVGLAASARRRTVLAEALARAGAARVTTLRDMPWPAADAHHDGRGPLAELLRWVDLETGDDEKGG